jgi:tRNA(Ile)-lysidine synthase
MDLVHEVEAYTKRHRLVEAGTRIVVGVSGGPDSVTLLHVLHDLSGAHDLRLHVAHLNHGIRGPAADADAAFVLDLAKAMNLPVHVERIDVPALADREKLTLEEAARRARYTFLCGVAQHIGARHIAVGHNADDQAETVLMHLLRGAGPAGLRGMLPATRLSDYHLLGGSKRPPPDLTLVRPLLNITRTTILAYCQEQGLVTRVDRSNLDTTHFRNKLRHEVLPYLGQINPRISERLRNLAEVVRADYLLLQEFVSIAYDTLLIASYPDAVVFDLTRWREQPLAIQRATLRRSLHHLQHSLRDVDFDHIERAVEVAQGGHTGAQATLPHRLQLTVGHTTLTIGEIDALHLPAERPWLESQGIIQVTIPGVTLLPSGWTLGAKETLHWNINAIEENPNPLVQWIDAAALGRTTLLRTRQEGDRFPPQGMKGAEVRLSDFLINIKMPRPWRDHLPLLVSDGDILWVTGVRLSEKASVHPGTQRVIHFCYTAPDDGARGI